MTDIQVYSGSSQKGNTQTHYSHKAPGRSKMSNQFNLANVRYRKLGFGVGSKGNRLAQNLENRSFSRLPIHISACLFYQIHHQNHQVMSTLSEKHYIFLVSLSQMHEKYCHFTFIVRISQVQCKIMKLTERQRRRNNNGFFFPSLPYCTMSDEDLLIERKKCLFLYEGLGGLPCGRMHRPGLYEKPGSHCSS